MSAAACREKMIAAGVHDTAIRCFERSYALLAESDSGLIPEISIQPVTTLPTLTDLPAAPVSSALTELLGRCAILKLNGGLGTGMGLAKAKSLLEVRPGVTFLDLIVRQIEHFRRATGADVRFLLMNSFSTSADTREFLARHPDIGDPDSIELLQNKIPKIDARTLAPVDWPSEPDHEWCPPGHGDLYPVLSSTGALDRLLADGVEILFVSNSDNLGASLDARLLAWFAASGMPFAMEVTARTESDRKGGHLARTSDGSHLILRESAQCPEADLDVFQDITRHRFFNTNNLWIRLDRLRDALAESGGFLPLPVIQNKKTVDPRDKNSPGVFQLESAMGAAIECFSDAGAIEVPRTRFAPVKTTADLLTLRSDAYEILADGTVQLVPECKGIPPHVDLDGSYKLVDQLEAALAGGAPSLKHCRSLRVTGPVRFSSDVELLGNVTITNDSTTPVEIPAGRYADQNLTLP